MKKALVKFAAGAALIAFANPASAAQWINFNTGGATSGAGKVFTDGKVNVRASGWSVDLASIVRQSTLSRYSQGLGVTYGKDNSHTVDNIGTRDFVLLQFDRAVKLDSGTFMTGWHGMKDTDATIGYGNLALPFTSQAGFNGQFAATALGGFKFFDSGAAGKSGNSTRVINPKGFAATSWIIGAGSATSPDLFADGFKLKGVSYAIPTQAVPEPSTWAMLLLGFGAIGGVMRARPGRTRAALRFA